MTDPAIELTVQQLHDARKRLAAHHRRRLEAASELWAQIEAQLQEALTSTSPPVGSKPEEAP